VLNDVLAYEAQDPQRLVPLASARAAYLSSLTWTRAILSRANA
jgi:hypothetical protein